MKQVTFVFTVNAINDEMGEHPDYAYFQVTQSFVDRVDELCGVMKDFNLSEVREISGPEFQDEYEHRLDCHELVVCPNILWFRASIKHGGAVETHAISPTDLDEQFAKAENNAVVFFGDEMEKDEALEWYQEAFAESDT